MVFIIARIRLLGKGLTIVITALSLWQLDTKAKQEGKMVPLAPFYKKMAQCIEVEKLSL